MIFMSSSHSVGTLRWVITLLREVCFSVIKPFIAGSIEPRLAILNN